jgi:hypothetical protein
VTGYAELVSIEEDDLDPCICLRRLLFLALASTDDRFSFDCDPKQPICVDEPCNLEVASLGGVGALRLQLRSFHAHRRDSGLLGIRQPDPG